MNFLSNLYQKVLISINIDVDICKVLTTFLNKSESEEKIFKTINGNLSNEAVKYIRNIRARFPFNYVSTVSKSKMQGLINGNNLSVFRQFNLTPSLLGIMLINKQWFVYIAKEDMIRYKESFISIGGGDLLFSPFCLLYEKIKSYLDGSKKLYILQERGTCVLMVADSNYVYFGNYVCFDSKNTIVEDSVDNLNYLKNADIIINVIKETLNNFYNDDRYASDFIEEILIFDTYGVSDNAVTYITNNMMLDIRFIQINICLEIEKLAKMELNL